MQEIVKNIHSAAAKCADFGPYTPDGEISEVTALLNKASGQMESATRMLKNMS